MRNILQTLKSVPCMDCITLGRDGIWPPECMQFDHVPERGPKLGSISSFWKDEEAFWIEIAKCDVICGNCHAIRTKARGVSAEKRKKSGDARKREWANPMKKSEWVANIRERMNSPETKQRMQKAQKVVAELPGRSEQLSASISKAWANPEKRKNLNTSNLEARRLGAKKYHANQRLMKLIKNFDRRYWMNLCLGER